MSDEINKYYTKLSYEVVKQIPYCVCPIHEINNNFPVHLGSGILITVDNRYFLATVSHNLEDTHSLCIPVPPDLHWPISGKTYRTIIDKKNNYEDKFDVALIELEGEIIDGLKTHYKFLDGSYVAINHNPVKNMAYIIIGYPKGKSKQNPKDREFKCIPFAYNTLLKDEESYKDLGYNSQFNIIVDYNIKNLNADKSQGKLPGPNPKGMSGGALFFVPYQDIDINTEPIMFYLVGILHHFHHEDKKSIIATKIDCITELIRTKFNINVPKSSVINLQDA